MGWPFSYRSSYQPKNGSIGWSTRHLLAEQTDDAIEALTRRWKNKKVTKFQHLCDGDLSGFESTSTISLEGEDCGYSFAEQQVQGTGEHESQHDYHREGEAGSSDLPLGNESKAQSPTTSKAEKCGTLCFLKSDLQVSDLCPPATGTGASGSSPDAAAQLYKSMPPLHMRLMLLLKGKPEDTIRCALGDDLPLEPLLDPSEHSNATLRQSRTGYEALSYVWGPTERKRTIEVELADDLGKAVSMEVTDNLYSALHHLRRESRHRFLWVDAICINQQSTADKNEQVRHMMRIYANADRVVIWLGPHANDSHLAMSMINHMNDKFNRTRLLGQEHDSEQCLSRLEAIYQALAALYSRPWFGRVWVRQEVMVAKDVIVWCGNSHTSWNALKTMTRRLNQIRLALQPRGLGQADIPVVPLENLALLKHGWIYGSAIARFFTARDSVYEMQAGGVLDLLMMGARLQATDARDKVYAFLGVGRVVTGDGSTITLPDPSPGSARRPSSHEVGEDVRRSDGKETSESQTTFSTSYIKAITGEEIVPCVIVDYNLTKSQVYQQAVKYMVNKYRSLDVLCTITDGFSKSIDMPTWCPDWDLEGAPKPFSEIDYLHSDIRAANDSMAEMQVVEEWGILRAQGYRVDKVAALLDWSTTVLHLCRLCLDMRASASSGQDAADLGFLDKAIRMIIAADPDAIRPFDPAKSTRRMCWTHCDRVALVPSDSEVGDEIWILKGGRLPFVLREECFAARLAHFDVEKVRGYIYEVVGPGFVPDCTNKGPYSYGSVPFETLYDRILAHPDEDPPLCELSLV